MDVSTFELLYRPLTPPLPGNTGAIARRVLQGYFLTVSNLDPMNGFRFRIVFRISLPQPADPSRTLANNALFISDVAGPGNTFRTSLTNAPSGSNRFTTEFEVPAGATALVVLLPDITAPGFFTTGPENIEIRGNVALELPCEVPGNAQPGRLTRTRPQAGAPARVLLHAELRATYLPEGWPAMRREDLDFDQTATTLTLASGKGANEIASQSACPFVVPERDIPDRIDPDRFDPDRFDPLQRVLSGLGAMAIDRENMAMLSEQLAEAGIPVRVVSDGEPER
jgi:hypothetical protein